MRRKVSVGDIAVIAAVCAAALLVALFPLLGGKEGAFVKVTTGLNGESVLLALEDDGLHTFVSGEHTLTVEIREGKVSVVEATCPDRVCVASGRISRGGEIIVCVPAMITVEILSENEEADYVIG